MTTTEPSIGLIGLGNVLMGDDALGPYTVRTLEAAYDVPAGVAFLDLGTPGPELADYLRDFESIIVVDTLRADGPPGDVRTYRRPEIVSAPISPRTSPHDPGFREALLTAELTGGGPRDALLIGAIPGSIAPGTVLSDAVRSSLPRIEELVVAELRRLGADVERCADPRRADIWWERRCG